MRLVASLGLLCCWIPLAACDDSSEGAPPATVADRLELDLPAARAQAHAALGAALGHEVTTTEALFAEGFSSTTVPPIFDHSRVLFVIQDEALAYDGYRLAYVLPLNGLAADPIDSPQFLRVRLEGTERVPTYVTATSGIVTFVAGTDDGAIDAVLGEVRAAHPSLVVRERLATTVIWDASLADHAAVLGAFAAHAAVSENALDGEVYRIPFEFHAAQPLTGDRVPLRAMMPRAAELRASTWFVTAPSLPAPLGVGAIAGDYDSGFRVTLAAGTDAAALEATLEAWLPGLVVERDGAGLVVSGRPHADLAASTIAAISEVAALTTIEIARDPQECGDGMCQPNESAASCPADCPR